MKLSDVKGDRTLELIAEIIDPIANIAEDPKAAELFRRDKLPEGTDAKKFLLNRARRCAPVLLKDHKTDVIAILAAVEGVPASAYASKLNLVKLLKDCTELLTDEAFGVLFISAQSETPSGSVQENTGDTCL